MTNKAPQESRQVLRLVMRAILTLWLFTVVDRPIFASEKYVPPFKDIHGDLDIFGQNLDPSVFAFPRFDKINQDNEFQYFQYHNSVFRKYKISKPRLSPGSSQILETSPGLFWSGNFEFLSDDTEPVLSDCREKKFDKNDFNKLVNDPEVRSLDDFLLRIPKDALQKFTLMYKSKSLQKDNVDSMNPRVIRFSTDGKFILTYVCSKESKKNTIEAMFFDDQTRKYNFLHTRFRKIPNQASNAITHKNPGVCFSCHGGKDPRVSWNEYETWPGAFGSEDDLIADASGGRYAIWNTTFNSQIGSETTEYIEVREHLKDEPCLSTLPWPEKSASTYWTYPYTPVAKMPNYRVRPNAHLTIVSSRLNAQRIARKFEEHPIWKSIKWESLALSLNCKGQDKASEKLKSILNSSATQNLGTGHPLHRVGATMGLTGDDWTLFSTSKGRDPLRYKYSTAQWDMTDFVLSVLYSDLSKEMPELSFYDNRYNRMSNLFGKNFMCVDKIADKLWVTPESQKAICKILEPLVQREMAEPAAAFPSMVLPLPSAKTDGALILKNVCADCHDGTVINWDFKNEDVLVKRIKEYGDSALNSVDQVLGSSHQCSMPHPASGVPCLSSKHKKSLLNYLKELTK
jgi:hypothetical protein